MFLKRTRRRRTGQVGVEWLVVGLIRANYTWDGDLSIFGREEEEEQ